MTAAVALRRSPPPRLLQRSLLLAALLHIWLVLILGNAAGTAAPGQGVWGSLTVKLLGRSGGSAGAPPGEPVPEVRDNGAPGQGAQQRQGGQVRPAAPPAAEPGAAELGRWNPREVPPEAARTEEASPAPPSTATLQLPEGFKPIERENVSTPTPRITPAPAVELPAAVGRLEARPEAAVTALPSTANLRAAPAPAAVTATSADLPAPVRRLEAPTDTGVAATALPRPSELRAAPGAVSQPLPTSAALPSAVQRLEAPATDGAAVTPLARSSDLRAPAAAAAATALPSGQDLPAPVRRLESADSAGGVTQMQPTPSARAAQGTPAASALPELSQALPGQVNAPTGPARGDPNANPYAAPRASAGSPDAGSRLGPDLAVPPSAAASAPRAPLNLSLPRGDIAARRGPGLVDVLPQPPERKSKLEQSIEDAANKDCRNAYAGAGLLAVVPLAVDTARGKGCKW